MTDLAGSGLLLVQSAGAPFMGHWGSETMLGDCLIYSARVPAFLVAILEESVGASAALNHDLKRLWRLSLTLGRLTAAILVCPALHASVEVRIDFPAAVSTPD